MNLNFHNNHPNADFKGRARLDIKLEGWPGTTAVGLISGALIAITHLILKARR